MPVDQAVQDAVWQFNEAVSILRELQERGCVPDGSDGLAKEVAEGLPKMQDALIALAHLAATTP